MRLKNILTFALLAICIQLFSQPKIDSVRITPNPCMGVNKASIEIFVSGGVPPYTFNWSGPNDFSATTQNIYDLFAGIYTLSAFDSEQTPVDDPNNGLFLIEDPDPLEVENYNIPCNPCTGACKIGLIVTGGTPPYNYTTSPSPYHVLLEWLIWNTTMDTIVIDCPFPGIYQISIEDANGCKIENLLFLVDEPDPIQLLIETSCYGEYNVSCHGCSDGSIWIAAGYGGNGDYSTWIYKWTDPKGFTKDGLSVTNLSAGLYILEMWDTANCYYKEEILLTEPDAPIYSDTVTVFDTITMWDTITVMDTIIIYDTLNIWDTLHIIINDTVYQFTEVAEGITFTDFPPGETITVTNYGDYLMTDRVFNSALIYNLIGSKIKQVDLSDKIPVSDLESGIYLFVFEMDAGVVFRKKIYIE